MSVHPNTSLKFPCGITMKNRFMLAPMTNGQSHEDGQLSETELHWLELRAKGQFGLVMTCASHVQENGKGFPGQLGIFSDDLIPGHQKLTNTLRFHDCISVIQLYHGGMRSPKDVIQQTPVCPSNNKETGARELTLDEVKQLRDDFISAAVRAKKCGYDGVEVHGAHGYILTQFISAEINHRTDEYGGDLTNRSRILFEIVDGIRAKCGKDFLIAVRLSPERFGMDIREAQIISQQLIGEGKIDFLDISLWDCFKYPEDEQYKEKLLLDYFTELDFKNVKLTVAGKIRTSENIRQLLATKVDFVTIGHAAILHADFPIEVIKSTAFVCAPTPVSKEYLVQQGLGENFIGYMARTRKGFVG